MRHLVSSEFGLVHAMQKPDLIRARPLLATLQAKWHADVLARFDAGLVEGVYAFEAAIHVYYVPPRGGVLSVQRRRVLVPGITYGSALWEPLAEELRATLRAHGVPAEYDRGLFGDVEAEKLIVEATREVQALRARCTTR